MNTTGHVRWIRSALIVGIVYLAAGIVFAALAKSAGSTQVRVAWRLAAWVMSAVAFAAHIGYERNRLRSSPAITALHVALAVALGAFGLAVSASLHSHATNHNFPAFALAVWPALTALPAFLVAWGAAAVISRTRPSAKVQEREAQRS